MISLAAAVAVMVPAMYSLASRASSRRPWRSFNRPGPAPLQQPGLRKRRVTSTADDHVVMHGDVEDAPRRGELLGYRAIVRRRGWVAARVIVHENHRARPLGDRFS